MIDQLSPEFVAAYAHWLGVTEGEAYHLLENEPLRDITDEEVTAAGWDESRHPRHPAGSEEGGEFAEVGELRTRLERASRTMTGDRPVVKLPPNPKVPGLDAAMTRWLRGRGQDSYHWVNEIRAEMADDLGLPYYGPTPYDHGSYIKPPPSRAEAQAAADTLLRGLREAQPGPEIWRGMTAYDYSDDWRAATDALLDARVGDTFTALPASWSTGPEAPISYSSALRYAGNDTRPGILLRALPGTKMIKPRTDYFGDREVLAAGQFEVVGVDRVKWVQQVGSSGDKNPKYDMLVVTVKQTGDLGG